MRVYVSTFLLLFFPIQIPKSNFRFGVSALRCFTCKDVYNITECMSKTTKCNTGEVCKTTFRLESGHGTNKYKINKECYQRDACKTAMQQNPSQCPDNCVFCCERHKCKTMDVCSQSQCKAVNRKFIPTTRKKTTTVATTTIPPTTTRSICDVAIDFLPLTSSAVMIEGQLSVSNTSLVSIHSDFFNSTEDQLLQSNEFKLQIQADVNLDCLKVTYENISNANSTSSTNQTNRIRMLLRCRIYNPIPSYTTTPLPTTSSQSSNLSSTTAATLLKNQRRGLLEVDWESHTSTGALSLETTPNNKSNLLPEKNTTNYMYEIYIVEGQVLQDWDELLEEHTKRIMACENITYVRLDFMIKPLITSEPQAEPEPVVAALGPVELGLIGASAVVIAGSLLLVGFNRWKVFKSLQRREARISPLHESASY